LRPRLPFPCQLCFSAQARPMHLHRHRHLLSQTCLTPGMLLSPTYLQKRSIFTTANTIRQATSCPTLRQKIPYCFGVFSAEVAILRKPNQSSNLPARVGCHVSWLRAQICICPLEHDPPSYVPICARSLAKPVCWPARLGCRIICIHNVNNMYL
jgi:hypothetical protein